MGTKVFICNTKAAKTPSFLALFCLLAITAITLHQVDAGRKDISRSGALPHMPSGTALRVLSLEFKEAVADLLWLRAVNFVGYIRETKKGQEWFYHLVDRMTDLDPKFKEAYKGGAITLSVITDYPNLSTQLLEKGMKNNPEDWQMPFYIGFNYLYHKKDFLKAAAAMEKASRIEGHPPYLPLLTARLYGQGKNRETAILFLKGVYLTTQNEEIKEDIAKRIVELEKEISQTNPK